MHIITHPSRPSWIIVNNFGWQVLQLCTGENPISEIIAKIKSQYDVPEKIIRKDVLDFFKTVEKSGILHEEKNVCLTLQPVSPKSVFLHITDKCNLYCKHCYASNMSVGEGELKEREIITFLDKFYAAGGNTVVLSGGEPLLRKELKRIFEINPSAHIKLLTNATLIDEKCASFLARHNVSIQVSIDGSNETVHDSIRGRGSFAAAVAGMERLIMNGLKKRINFCTTMMRQNLHDLPNILNLANKMEIPLVRYLPLRRKGNAQKNWQDINNGVTMRDYEKFYRYVFDVAIKQYPELDIECGLSGYILDSRKLVDDGRWCPIGKNMVIDTRGNVYPCVLFMEERFKLGNIKQHSIEDIMSAPILTDLVLALEERKNRIMKCSLCMWKNFCQSSCMGFGFVQHGNLWDTDGFCDFRKKLYEKAVIRMINKKSLKSKNADNIICE